MRGRPAGRPHTGPKTLGFGGGLVFRYMNHNANVKAFYLNAKQDSPGQKAQHQLNIQTQFFLF